MPGIGVLGSFQMKIASTEQDQAAVRILAPDGQEPIIHLQPVPEHTEPAQDNEL